MILFAFCADNFLSQTEDNDLMGPPIRNRKNLKNLIVDSGEHNNHSLDFDDEAAKILEAFPLDVSEN
jgi:hypothetical protein